MQAVADVLKVFVEKHLIPTVLSFVFACIASAKLPVTFLGRDKYDAIWFLLFVWASSFIIIELSIQIYKAIRRLIDRFRDNEHRQAQIQKGNEEAIKQFWTIVDKYSDEDKEMLSEFLKNGNKPIINNAFSMGGGLLDSQFVYKTEKSTKTDLYSPEGKIVGFRNTPVYHYVLTNEFFELLKYSNEKYGRISHFD